jgi:hypothetical protein
MTQAGFSIHPRNQSFTLGTLKTIQQRFLCLVQMVSTLEANKRSGVCDNWRSSSLNNMSGSHEGQSCEDNKRREYGKSSTVLSRFCCSLIHLFSLKSFEYYRAFDMVAMLAMVGGGVCQVVPNANALVLVCTRYPALVKWHSKLPVPPW